MESKHAYYAIHGGGWTLRLFHRRNYA